MIGLADIPVCEFTAPATVRLISTAYIDEPALAPLADNPSDLANLEALEGQTSARRGLRLRVPEGLDPVELLMPRHAYGWTYVNAAFCYTRATGNRFNGPERGAWYAAHGPHAQGTAQAEVVWHLTRELGATGLYDNITCYRELIAGFMASFHDLTGVAKAQLGTILDPDPKTAYPAGQRLAQDVLASGGNGLLYASVRHRGGDCVVALRPHLVQNIRQGETWEMAWAGTPKPQIRRLPGRPGEKRHRQA